MMSQHSQHSQTNGASLEDCHTNFFTLTDLCGIRWRVFRWENASGGDSDPLEDPVLVSYSRCLSADVLCVWRRTWHSQSLHTSGGLDLNGGLSSLNGGHKPPSTSLRDCPKELWVFWYRDEPDLSSLISPQLTKSEDKSGSFEDGISYECRTILFKALHNLIERCLLTRDFVRLGKWFIQPYDGPERLSNKNTHLSFSLSFFVHGESTVCASVDVRQHPPVRRLNKKHILSAQQNPQGIPVILGPYGLKGSLTGVTHKNSDPQTQKLLDDWKKFFPLDSRSNCSPSSNPSGSSSNTSGTGVSSRENNTTDGPSSSSSSLSSVPSVVEVISGGYKLRYPSSYVLVTEMDEEPLLPNQPEATSTQGNHSLSQHASLSANKDYSSLIANYEGALNHDDDMFQDYIDETPATNISPFIASTHTLLSTGYIQKGGKGLGWARGIGELVWQDMVQCPGPSSSHYDGLTPEGAISPAEVAGQWEFGDPAFKVNCSCLKVSGVNSISTSTSTFGGYKTSSVTTPGSVPSLRNSCVNDGPPPSVESPVSITPSPLPTPRTPQSQPPSVPHHDQSHSLLSPHPPASNVSLGDPTTPAAPHDTSDSKCTGLDSSLGQKSTTSLNQVSSPYPSGSLEVTAKHSADEASELIPPADSSSTSSSSSSSSLDAHNLLKPSLLQHGPLTMNSIDGPHHSSHFSSAPLRKPNLPQSDYHHFSDLEGSLVQVYDHTKFTAWLQHPVKKFRPHEQKSQEPLWPPYRPSHMAQKFELNSSVDPKFEIKMESDASSFLGCKKTGGIKRPASDPYDFDDDPSTSGTVMDSFKTKEEIGSIKPSDQTGQLSPNRKIGNLYTIEGITPKVSDLDEIFDSPVDDYPVQTPPGSNKPLGLSDDTGTMVGNKIINPSTNSKNGTSNTFELTQLTKMYPTPPSLEHNTDHDTTEETPISQTHMISIKQEPLDDPFPEFGLISKEEMDVFEPPLVFKPQIVSPFIGSDRYKPHMGLPSMEDKEFVSIPSDFMQSLRYNPSWQQFTPTPEKSPLPPPRQNVPSLPHSNQSAFGNSHSVSSLGPPLLHEPSGPKIGMSPISPATNILGECNLSQKGPASVGPPSSAGPSLNYELPSPASNQSSYLNRTLPSVEAPSSCAPSLQVPEANSLLTNVVLQDSSINLFRDHNFDSCTMCVCINGDKVVGSIRGSDGSLYLPPSHLSSKEEMLDECKCGFSAVVNRKLAFQSGLFYEDEVDLTGLHEGLKNERKKPSLQSLLDSKNSDSSDRDINSIDSIPQYIFELVQSQSLVTLCTPSSVLYKAISVYHTCKPECINAVEYKDGNEMALIALEQSRLDYIHQAHLADSDLHNASLVTNAATASKTQVMHRWCYLQFDGPACSQDMVCCMKALQPFLQEAIQKKRNTRLWEPVYNVSGPLTWRQFHRMAVRGTEDRAEPLPIPLLLAGHEKDWLSIAPQSIRNWEKLLLEPYSRSRNVAYVVVSPDNEFILNHVRAFFKELSSIYELCQLGRHAPIRRVLVDGIMRVSKRAAGKVAHESMDDWFTLLGDSHIFTKLRIYSQICCHTLAPHLTTLSMDKSLFEVGNNRASEQKQQHMQQVPSPMPPPPSTAPPNSNSANNGSSTNPSANGAPSSTGNVQSQNGPEGEMHSSATPVTNLSSGSSMDVEDDDSPPPAIMVYLIDPFTVHQDNPDMHRLITLGLLRCYKAMLEKLPESMQSHVYVQIISLESILELARESHDKSKRIDQLKSLAFSVFMQCRRILTHTSNVKSLTGFGPAAEFDSFLRPTVNLEERSLHPYPVFSPAYILAPVKESRGRQKEAEEALGDPKEKSTVLYCTYCISEDQRWLLASATDELGEILQTVSINIEIPNRTRRKKASSRRHGLKKLMDWLLGVMSIGANPWRLVIGRLGRIGHGELKGWLSLLSRKSLALTSKNLKEMCKQCSYLFPGDAPCILSACLVSLEPDSSFRIMPDIFTPDERFGQNSQNCHLSTPQDVTCTHILVFPTSATAQTAHGINQDEPTFEEGDIFGDEDPIGNEMGMGILGDMDIFADDLCPPPYIDTMGDGVGQQDSLSHSGSPIASGIIGGVSPSQHSGQARSNGVVMVDPQEEIPSLLQQQPLALGYYVSTASTGKLPHWFWSSCPHLESSCPTFLKSALHLNQPAVTQAEDYMHNNSGTKVHPLDSTKTADVLRHVLEGYNSLSWLMLDPATQDRRSCLPLHMQVLSHLYNLMASLI